MHTTAELKAIIVQTTHKLELELADQMDRHREALAAPVCQFNEADVSYLHPGQQDKVLPK